MLRAFSKLNYRYIILCWILLFSAACLHGQKRDTLDLYKRIKKSAIKRKSTKLLYEAIFVDPVTPQYEKKPLSNKQKQADPNAKFEGRIIRDIQIIVYNPFGYSVNDTFTRNINRAQRAGNNLHINTRHRIIRNILLFEPGDTITLIRITESERLLRQARYVNDARIFITGDRNKDSADILVKVLDKWSLDVSLSGGTDGGSIRIRDRNLSGLGQTYEQRIGYYMSTGYDYRGNYNISNIKNSFISSDLSYATTKEETKTGISFNRPFYSPLARWAGGAAGNRVWGRYRYRDTVDRSVPFNYYNYDFWLAESFALGRKKKTEKNSNIVLGLRYAATTYLERPSFDIDTHKLNVHTDLYLASIGYSFRRYYKDQFIYRFGANEDVPEGLLIQATYGVVKKEIIGIRYYTGFEISKGKHFKKAGYISGNFAFGTYYHSSFKSNSTINAGVFYFSNLNQKGKWYFRNFASYKLIHGLNKEPYERITLKSGEMYGFNPGEFTGTGKMILNLEAVAYAPYNIIGFKFAPLVLIGFGILEDTNVSKYISSRIYQAYSLGVLLRNENLLNSSFEFTVGFYPELPGGGRDVFKLNPVGSFSLKVRNFDISKPGTVGYD